MINIPNNRTKSFDDKLLTEGQTYTVGINDGVHFKKVIFVGTKLFNGKEMMVFKTEEKQQITINNHHTLNNLHNKDRYHLHRRPPLQHEPRSRRGQDSVGKSSFPFNPGIKT